MGIGIKKEDEPHVFDISIEHTEPPRERKWTRYWNAVPSIHHLSPKFPRSSFINVSSLTRCDRPKIKRVGPSAGSQFCPVEEGTWKRGRGRGDVEEGTSYIPPVKKIN